MTTTTTAPSVSDLRAAWTLDPEVTFLNHGSFGACPKPVLAVQAELRERMEREPVLFLAREVEALMDRARAFLAEFIGADAQDVVHVNNATSGVNAVLRSLVLEPGDEILVTDQGYNACNNAVDFVTRRAGAKRVFVPLPFPIESPDQVVEAVLERVTAKTRLALIDHVTSPTGLLLPIERLVPALRERGVETLVDGAHAPGMRALDLRALDPAYYTGNAHKWLCAPKGAAFLYVRRDLQPAIRPLVISHGANSQRTDRSRFQLEFGWPGTDDPTPWLALPTALQTMRELVPGGWPEVRRRNHELVLYGRSILCDALGVDPPAPESMIGSLGSVPLPPASADGEKPDIFAVDPLQRMLFDQHRIEVPISSWPAPPQRLLRISAQLYNRPDEYERLGSVLRAWRSAT